LSQIFDELDLQYVIVGGIAVIHYGFVRSTQDVDIILEDDKTKFPALFNLFKKYEFDFDERQFFLGYQEKTNISIFDKKSHMRLDVMIARRSGEKEVLKNAIQDEILGNKLYIAPLEYVLLGKIIYMGQIDAIPEADLFEYQDVIDFLTIYHANKDQINEAFLTKKIKELGLESTWRRLQSLEL
jgi:hypothetical protein